MERDSALNNQWNFLNPGDFLKPRVFICKAGRFLDTMSYQMGGEGSVKSRDESDFGSETFEESCDPAELLEKTPPAVETTDDDVNAQQVAEESVSEEGEDGASEDEDVNHTIAVIDARNKTFADFKLPPEGEFKLPEGNQISSFHDLPILVLEGLQKPQIDQTEEELVSNLLANMVPDLPKNAVRTAIRLPLKQQTNGKSIVLVELDTEEHENLILKKRNSLRKDNLQTKMGGQNKIKNTTTKQANGNVKINDKYLYQRWKNLGVRRAKFKELWKFVEELAVVKRITNISPESIEHSNSNANKIENNEFLFGTAAATSLNVKDTKKETSEKTSSSPLPPQLLVRKKTPLKVFEGSGDEDSSLINENV